VKKVFKISGAVFTAVIYSIAVFLAAENIAPLVTPVSETQSSGIRILFEESSSGILGIPLTQESSVNLFNGAKYSGSDFQHKTFTACLKHSEKTISSEFVQYVFQAKNFPVKLRKADLLFPFHYFW
jgi:hypothetical protein